jgi:hypothetical protein
VTPKKAKGEVGSKGGEMREENRLCGFGVGLENKQDPEFNKSREETIMKSQELILEGGVEGRVGWINQAHTI